MLLRFKAFKCLIINKELPDSSIGQLNGAMLNESEKNKFELCSVPVGVLSSYRSKFIAVTITHRKQFFGRITTPQLSCKRKSVVSSGYSHEYAVMVLC